jgi:hypothetical protein
VISNSFPKKKAIAAKITKISLFPPSIYGQFEIALWQVAVHVPVENLLFFADGINRCLMSYF